MKCNKMVVLAFVAFSLPRGVNAATPIQVGPAESQSSALITGPGLFPIGPIADRISGRSFGFGRFELFGSDDPGGIANRFSSVSTMTTANDSSGRPSIESQIRSSGSNIFSLAQSQISYDYVISASDETAADALRLAIALDRSRTVLEFDRSDHAVQINGLVRLSGRVAAGDSFSVVGAVNGYNVQCGATFCSEGKVSFNNLDNQEFSRSVNFNIGAEPISSGSKPLEFRGRIFSQTLISLSKNSIFGTRLDVFVDPIISVNSVNGLNSSLYRIAVSPTIGNGSTAPVPEPASWGLLIVGFAVSGAAVRRKRREITGTQNKFRGHHIK